MTDAPFPETHRATLRPLCWLCFLDRVATRLDAESHCPFHGLIRDRVLGIVHIDAGFLTDPQVQVTTSVHEYGDKEPR